MSDSAVLTTAMSSMSIAVATQTTARVQRWVVVTVVAPGDRGGGEGATSMLPAGGREHIRGIPSRPGARCPWDRERSAYGDGRPPLARYSLRTNLRQRPRAPPGAPGCGRRAR